MNFFRLINKVSPTFVVFIISLIFLMANLSAQQWDPLSFVLIGGKFDPSVYNQSYGYDGQFYYQIAKDPINGWRFVDVPAYRYQRILYPILARIFSFGNEFILPWMMILINWSSIILGCWLLEKMLIKNRFSVWYALSYGLFAGLWLSLRLDLTEPPAYLFVIAAIFAIQKDKKWLGSILFALASLTREVAIVFGVSYFFYFVRQFKIHFSIKWALVIFLPFLTWQALLFHWFGDIAIKSGGAFSTPIEFLPYRGWWGFAFINLPNFFLMSVFVFPTAILPSAVSLYISLREFIHRSISPATWMLLLNSILIIILPRSVMLDPLGMIRTLIGLVLAVLIYGIEKRSYRALNFSLLWIFLFIFVLNNGFLPNYP